MWSSDDGLCLFAKRLARGRFIWPQATNGVVHLPATHVIINKYCDHLPLYRQSTIFAREGIELKR